MFPAGRRRVSAGGGGIDNHRNSKQAACNRQGNCAALADAAVPFQRYGKILCTAVVESYGHVVNLVWSSLRVMPLAYAAGVVPHFVVFLFYDNLGVVGFCLISKGVVADVECRRQHNAGAYSVTEVVRQDFLRICQAAPCPPQCRSGKQCCRS